MTHNPTVNDTAAMDGLRSPAINTDDTDALHSAITPHIIPRPLPCLPYTAVESLKAPSFSYLTQESETEGYRLTEILGGMRANMVADSKYQKREEK